MADLLRKIIRFGTLGVLAIGVVVASMFVGGSFGGDKTSKSSLITGVPFAYADAPAPPAPTPVPPVGSIGSGGSGCGGSSSSSSSSGGD